MLALVVGWPMFSQAVLADEPLQYHVQVDAAQVQRTFEPRRLGGTNVALWNEVRHFQSPQIRQWVQDLQPGYIRLPGGSWSNSMYWNGNGVRGKDGKVDPTKVGPDGFPTVDYSGYQPSFPTNSDDEHHVIRPSTGYAGNVDVKTLQDWIASLPGVQPLPCLNAGTGRPVDAAEWVRWSNQTHLEYHANIWEIGNELDGSWEPGHFMNGSKKPVTPEIFSQRFTAIANAMHAVDPTVKIGACAFAEAMLRDCGKNVGFASIHAYPGSASATPQENLANVAVAIGRDVSNVKGWIQKYQPDRAKEIELGYTEWNTFGGLNHSDLFSGLWDSAFLAEMTREGVDFSTQWDLFTHTRGMAAGHALIFTDGDTFTRKAAFYSLWLWNRYTGNRVLQSKAEGAPNVYTLATADDNAVYLQFINGDEDREVTVSIDLKNFDPAAEGERAVLSNRQYFWDVISSTPLWSQEPAIDRITTGKTCTITLPPFSVTHLRVPSSAKPALTAAAMAAVPAVAQGKVELKLLMPDEVYVGDHVAANLLAFADGTQTPYPVALPAAQLTSTAGNVFDRDAARLTESVGRFIVTAREPGTLTITATSGDASVSKTITVKPSEPRPMVIWDFASPTLQDAETFSSELGAVADATVRADKKVARIDLNNVKPSEKDQKRALLVVRKFPGEDRLNHANIRGAVFDISSKDLHSDDPNASVEVVMQSPANYWMVLGHIPLKDIGQWKTHQVVTTDAKLISAMPATYNIWFVLNSGAPVTGTVFLDKIGLMVR